MSTLAARAQAALVRTLPASVVYRLAERRHALYEPELRRVHELLAPGTVAVDVGAWLGPWTRALSRRAAHVHAFEPQPALAARLRRVVAPNVTVHEAAVGASPGVARLVIDHASGRDSLSHLARTGEGSEGGATVEHVEVDVVRLDDLDLGEVGFLKVDVEGHEGEVLDGAVGLLERCRPVVLVEVEQRHLGAPIDSVFARLADRGWSGWFLRRAGWQPLASFDLDEHQTRWIDDLPDQRYVNNFAFTPGPQQPG